MLPESTPLAPAPAEVCDTRTHPFGVVGAFDGYLFTTTIRIRSPALTCVAGYAGATDVVPGEMAALAEM